MNSDRRKQNNYFKLRKRSMVDIDRKQYFKWVSANNPAAFCPIYSGLVVGSEKAAKTLIDSVALFGWCASILLNNTYNAPINQQFDITPAL